MSVSIEDVKDDIYAGSFEVSQNALSALLEFIEKNKTSDAEKLVEECNQVGKKIIKSKPNMVNIRRKISAVIYHMKRLAKSNKSAEDIKKTSKSKIQELIKLQNLKRRR